MARKTPTKARRGTASKLLRPIKKHPLRALGVAGVAGGAVVAGVLLTKAANTAAKVATIKAAGGAAKEVVGAMKKPRAKAKRRAAPKARRASPKA